MNPINAHHRDMKLVPDGARMTIASGLRLHKVYKFGSAEDGASCGIGSVQWRHHVTTMVTALVDQDSSNCT